jgi:peptidoglycan hydrolase CwlO-like protein
MKKLNRFLILIALVLVAVVPAQATNYDFPNQEEYYANLCSSAQAVNYKEACTAYQNYINQKALDAASDLEALRQELKDIKNNILKYAKQVTDYQKQIETIQSDIVKTENAIAQSEDTIEVLSAQIAEREANIAKIDTFIKERMVAMQSFIALNSYFDFIMGAKDFVDLVRRVEGINDITAADRDQINALTEEVAAFNADKAELERQVAVLEENKANLVKNKATIIGLQDAIEIILLEYRNQEAELMAKEEYMAANLSNIQDQLKAIAGALNNILPSDGWIRPLKSGYIVSAGAWSYPNGGTHLAIDLGTPLGSEVLAVGNGVVIYTANSCPTDGYYGSTCGSPGASRGGNQVYMMVSVDNATYGIIYMHLMKDTPIATGTIVNQGDVIGKSGDSGSSTGPHLHIEVHYLGTNSVSYYAQKWNGDLSFGSHWGNAGLAYRCDLNGNTPPCRKNPLKVFGVSVFSRY